MDIAGAKLVRAYHLSFLDYLKHKFSNQGWPTLPEIHRVMSINCLTILRSELRFNICGLDNSSVLNSDVPDLAERIVSSISGDLQYGALFWMTHVASAFGSGSETDDEIRDLVHGLVCHRRIFFWLEVTVLIGQIERAIDILRRCGQHFTVSEVL